MVCWNDKERWEGTNLHKATYIMSSMKLAPYPKVDNLLVQLSGAKVFSKLDANSGSRHWQTTLAKNLAT